uniref:CUB domain-containing protein n=1 Tax=Daphnia galeata TaxID=27404 RepID=A0A8J2RRT8_9CRUS|nr:unnamed protein product [Daphnia galeata]
MAKCVSLLCALLMLQVSRAYDGDAEEDLAPAIRQYSGDFLLQFQPVKRPMTTRLPDYSSLYESRTPIIRPQLNINSPFKKYLFKSETEKVRNHAENRLFVGLFNNVLPSTNAWGLLINPLVQNSISCTTSSGESGICTLGSVCSLYGGRLSGSCSFGRVCCINTVATCGGTVTLNNTYWQSPSTGVSASSTCALKIHTDATIAEQSRKPICQIRLDFITFATAQPTAGTCTDTFTVSGATTVAPTICGDNSGQHMYLDVPSSDISPNEVQLKFTFSSAVATRFWNVKIETLPCGATYLAPADCLQYFSAASGRVKSFNWQDVAGTATRQLNNQNYNICLRKELVSSQKANKMCVSVCAVTNGGDAFSITTPTSTSAANAAAAVVAATTDLANAQTALTNAQTALTAAQTTLATNQAALVAAQTALTTATDAVTAAQDVFDTAEAAVPVAQTALTDAQTEPLQLHQATLATAQADLAAAQAAVTDPANPTQAETDAITAAQAAVDTAQAAVDVAQTGADNAQTAVDAAQTNVDNAQTALASAQTAVSDAQTALTNAQTAATDAQTAVNTAQTAVDNAQADVVNAQGPVTAAQITVANAQVALTAAQTALTNAANSAAPLSGVGISTIVNGVNTATCLYDFLLIPGARDSTNAEADRFCGNALNPAITPVATSVQVCTSNKQVKMTYRTDGTENAVVAGANVLPAPADSGNVGFCLDYQEK